MDRSLPGPVAATKRADRRPAGLPAFPWGRLLSLEAVCAALLVVLVTTMCAQVFTRYVLAAPFTWVDEVNGLAFTWLTFLAAAVALKHRGHIAFTFVADLCPPAARRWMLVMVACVVIAFLVLVGVLGVRMALLVHTQLSASLELPMSSYYAALPVGAALMAWHEALHLRALWRGTAA